MKGKLEDMMSRARFVQGEFYVQYRDFKELIQLPVAEFWKIAEIVPQHRIARIIEVMSSEDGKRAIPIYESSDPDLLALPITILNEVDLETLRFVQMRDALNTANPWHRYLELERIKAMKEEGRELLGKAIYLEEKRDGENLSLWLDENDVPHVSSHNMVNADPNICSRFMNAPEYDKAVELLRRERDNFKKRLILYGELVNKGKGPTRIEPTHKYAHWYLFDIYNIEDQTYYPYVLVYQTAYHYKLPMIQAHEIFTPWSMEELLAKIPEWKAWAKRHKREGVVGKVYEKGQLFGFKEKIDLPDLPPFAREQREKATFPPMPEETILRALYHAWNDLVEQNSNLNIESLEVIWKNKAMAMPVVAKHISMEAKEHSFNPPRNIFEIYLNTPIEKIKAQRQ